MPRALLIRIFLIPVIYAFASFGPASSVQANTVMQCMADCIKQEGNTASAKSTCKLRCADVAMPNMSGGNKPDCMSTYKTCKRACGSKDKACTKQCKQGLMNCK